ncbi:DUF1501 domain-containing protein [Tautonia plasticadhaerens]|uniref:DUF1501 domain-containing protein n=1 Tax=Tautonia plasticadhaerens TaxID=2527974 RepID=A0A518HD89_9BACT|nr:DUF1501 domain-containing protein [Tautonia plasticadhaerens]QDV38828.1 hypothetical protein ElP_67860 [Tautonia plasticadhaerens]
MMTLGGPSHRYCDGRTRRSFLKIGGLAMGGLGLPHLLRAEQAAGVGRSHKAVIMVYLSGGLSHQDTFDLKPEAPEEIRGEFAPIDTSVPGVRFGELLPKLAGCADKLAVIRSIVGLRDEHTSWQNLTGYPMGQAQREGKPHFGSVVTRLRGDVNGVVPPFCDLFPTMQHRPYNSGGPGLLGLSYAGARLGDGDQELMTQTKVEPARFDRRKALLDRFDDWRDRVDSQPVDGMDAFYRRAFDVLTSDTVAKALDPTREDPRVRDRYGVGSSTHLGDGAPMWNDQLLIARRLVEAGARVVTVAYGFWDTHGNNFDHLRTHLPLFDQGISALVEDLHARGLEKDVTVVVWGEFGRTPKINKDAGRDHWAKVNSALLAGGGLDVGQVIGSTDKVAGSAVSTPIHYQDVLATVYDRLGIDPHGFVDDLAGRPIPILPSTARPIRQLI